MTDFAFDVKERVRDATDIVELVSRYIPLRRLGQNYVGRCPWHDDSRPSLQVNPNRQSFKCWVCNIGGDVFSFVMQIENVDFREALEILADQAGIELPKQQRANIAVQRQFQQQTGTPDNINNNTSNGESAQTRQNAARPQEPLTKKTLYRALDWVAQKYHEYLLAGNEAGLARDYLNERGITAESIRKFRLGYAPLQRDWLLEQIKRDPHRVKILEMSGVLARRQEENNNNEPPQMSGYSPQPYDRFRGRLMFPIRDMQDRTIAFGGRLLPGSTLQSRAKYVNSPETYLFSKHKQLYGLDLARLTMRNTRRALIMEGYTDVIMAHQFGFSDAVAVLGTALGAEHIRILKRFVEKMVLVLDGDEAGRKRADEVLELFIAQGADIETLTLPGNADPCEFLLAEGAEAFNDQLQHHTTDALEHAFLSASRGVDLANDIIGTSRALDKVLGIIASAPAVTNPTDPRRIRFEKTIQRLAERFGLPEKEIRGRLRQLWETAKRQAGARRPETGDRRQEALLNNQNIATPNQSTQRKQVLNETENVNDEKNTNHNDDDVNANLLAAGNEEDLNVEYEGYYIGEDSEAELSRLPSPASLLPEIPWEVSGILPGPLEIELLEAWLTAPESFEVFRERIPLEWLISPVTRLVYRVCCEFSDAGTTPTFERLMTRFDDAKMKTMLVTWDESAAEKEIAVNDRLIAEIIDGFERQQEERSRPREIGRLRAEELSGEEKMRLLLEIQEKQKKLKVSAECRVIRARSVSK
ncbi:MAG: toprim domain-containing protein [Planctomycetaceae bacterium]|jgi:DNA primase|nr:toprim domain-containing protein [Planctomycetaceae bacterium]